MSERLRVPGVTDKLSSMRLVPALVVLVALLAAGAARADSDAQERVIRYAGDTLTVRLAKVAVTDVLDEVGRQAGAEIRGTVRTPRDVSVEFDAVPISDALHRLLGDQNFALVYGHEGQLKSVRLLGGPLNGSVARPPPNPAMEALAAATSPGTANVMEALAKHGAVPIAGHLGDALGGQRATLFQLLDLSTHHADPTVRAEAARALIAAVDTDPVLRTNVLSQLNTMDDAALAEYFRNSAGDNAEEVAMQILSSARAPEIRSRATAVLQRLRTGG